jgi:uncharacterized protein YndB with AHSA1/START domain
MESKNETVAERRSDRELVVTRTFAAPARLVYRAWTEPDVFVRWWVPKSFGLTLVSYEMDIRVGGTYRLVFSHPAAPEPMAFHGRYTEVVPNVRLVWTNEEAGGPGPVTTVTFAEEGGRTCVVVHDLYPTKEALDEAITSGSSGAMPEQLDHLAELLVTLSPE